MLFGANDMGSLMIEENVVAEAGTVHYLSLQQIREAIEELGFEPRQRDVFYNLFRRSGTEGDRGKPDRTPQELVQLVLRTCFEIADHASCESTAIAAGLLSRMLDAFGPEASVYGSDLKTRSKFLAAKQRQHVAWGETSER